jgi:alpha-galactosidase
MRRRSKTIRRSKLYATLFLAIVMCAGAVSGVGQSINGRWVALGKFLDNGERQKTVLDLKQTGNQLTGIVTTMAWRTEVEGAISGNQFKIYSSSPDRQTLYSGVILENKVDLIDSEGEKLTAAPASDSDLFPSVAYIEPPALHAVPSNGLALSPPMGWNSWNLFAGRIDDKTVRTIADAMVSSGMRDAGYVYVNIDDTWEGVRDSSGNLQPNHKFPDMKSLADYVHSKGLKLGIYSSPGPRTCAEYPGTYGHEVQDAKMFASWGVDYLKYDWCSAMTIYKNEQLQAVYQKMGDALQASGRPIVFSLCEYGLGDVQKWGADVGGNLWRTTGDINDTWSSMISNVEEQSHTAPYAKPGHWNDPDMLEIGNGHMTDDEYRTHMSLWALVAAPLLAGNDLRNMSAETASILLNREVIAIDQDPLGRQAAPLRSGDLERWEKPLADGSVAVGVVNLGPSPLKATVAANSLTLKGKVARVRDLWTHKEVRFQKKAYSATIPSHGILLLRVWGDSR